MHRNSRYPFGTLQEWQAIYQAKLAVSTSAMPESGVQQGPKRKVDDMEYVLAHVFPNIPSCLLW